MKSLSHVVRKSTGNSKTLDKEEVQGGDLFQFISMLLSFQAVFFKNKLVFWISFFLCLSAFYNRRARAAYTQLIFLFA